MALRATKNNADAQCADAMESMACGASSKERDLAVTDVDVSQDQDLNTTCQVLKEDNTSLYARTGSHAG